MVGIPGSQKAQSIAGLYSHSICPLSISQLKNIFIRLSWSYILNSNNFTRDSPSFSSVFHLSDRKAVLNLSLTGHIIVR